MERKQYPPNYLKPNKEMRAKRIKAKYLESGMFRDSNSLNCGNQIAYEMEQDFRAMQSAIHLLRDAMSDFLNDDDVQIATMKGRDMLILNAILTLRERINTPDNDDERRYESTELIGQSNK